MIAAAWWTGRAAERYWLEATDREDIGVDLRAPDSDASGRDNWRYTLFRQAVPGDVVFHYDGRSSAITARSEVAGPPTRHPIVWAARGSYARTRGAEPKMVEGYVVPLIDTRLLPTPVTLEALRGAKGELLEMLAGLRETLPKGTPLYFPFELSDRPVRPLQGYAFKLPAAFVARFGLDAETGAAADSRLPWTDADLSEVLDVYDGLLDRQTSGDHPNYAEVIRDLATRLGRGRGAVDRRLQTITSMRRSRGLATVARFAEAQSLTPGIDERLARLTILRTPHGDPEALDRLTAEAESATFGPPAAPVRTAPVQTATVTRFLRRADVRGWVLRAAESVCEGCGDPAPFFLDDGRPFLEVHHIRPLREGGPDTVCNAAALCPNCHRRLHFSSDRSAYRAALLAAIPRLIDYPVVTLGPVPVG